MAEKKMWGGRFKEQTARKVEEFTQSVEFDRNLYAEDIAGSKAHAKMLAKQGVLTAAEADDIVQGLNQVLDEIEKGEFAWRTELEDVHMNIESRLTKIIGPLGGKLHTGRSRNDQVALDFRLHVAARLELWTVELTRLITVLADRAQEHVRTIMPGYTHLQPAQPVTLAHHLLAYVQMFRRDHERISDCLKRVRISPLGAAALAGTTYDLDACSVADELGLSGSFANSLDAVSDRDFVLESLFSASLIMAHLSRLSEELIIWANPNFGFVRLPDAYSTGSSIMPQKKNPDISELTRGKTGRVYGDLMSMLTTIKGLPLAYNRDMQEDKEPFFDADRTVGLSLGVTADMMGQMEFVPEAMLGSVKKGFLNATELADYLVGKGIPFREAHEISGSAVGYAEGRSKGLEDLTIDELQTFSKDIDQDVFKILDYKAAVERRATPGGTGSASVDNQLDNIRKWLAKVNA